MRQQMLKGCCQFRLPSNSQHCQNLPPALDAAEAALLTREEPLCDEDSVDSAALPVPVVLPAVVSAGVEESVAEAPAVATPVGVVPLV
jgi:hypothetical protein